MPFQFELFYTFITNQEGKGAYAYRSSLFFFLKKKGLKIKHFPKKASLSCKYLIKSWTQQTKIHLKHLLKPICLQRCSQKLRAHHFSEMSRLLMVKSFAKSKKLPLNRKILSISAGIRWRPFSSQKFSTGWNIPISHCRFLRVFLVLCLRLYCRITCGSFCLFPCETI